MSQDSWRSGSQGPRSLKTERGKLEDMIVAVFLACIILTPATVIISAPLLPQSAFAQVPGGEPLVPVAEDSISRSFSTTLLYFEGEPAAEITQTITWYKDGRTVVSDSRGYSYSIAIPPNAGVVTLLQNSTTVAHQVAGTDMQYGIYWIAGTNSKGEIDKYKFTVVGTSALDSSKIYLKVDGLQHSSISENRFIVTQPTDDKGRITGVSLDPSLDWTPQSVREGTTDAQVLANATSSDGLPKSAEQGLGLDWSDAIAAGYNMSYDAQTSTITIDVGKAFAVDPVTVAQISYTVSPAKNDYYEGEKRVTKVDKTFFAFFYDGSNIVYKTSTDEGVTWSSTTYSTGTGVLAPSDGLYRWSIVGSKISGTDYIALVYFKAAGSNMEFYAKRGTVSGSSITWSEPRLLGYTAANSACGSGGACPAVVLATDTSQNIYGAFRWLSGGATSYSYRILNSWDGGYSWQFLYSQVDNVSGTRPSMALTKLAAGDMLFAYAKYPSSEFTYRILDGTTSWTAETVTSGAGMSTNTIKQISSDSDNNNKAYIAYTTGHPGSLKVAKWTNTGSFDAFETLDTNFSHYLPSITTYVAPSGTAHRINIFTIASNGTIYNMVKVGSGSWLGPFQSYGNTFTNVDSLTAPIWYAGGLWQEGSASPYNLRFDTILVVHDEFYSFGDYYWGNRGVNDYTGTKIFYCREDNGANKTSCQSGLIDGRTNYVEHTLQKSSTNAFAFQVAFQGTSPFGEADNTHGASVPNKHFPISAVGPYIIQAQYVWRDDTQVSISKPDPNAPSGSLHANLVINLWLKNTVNNDLIVIDFFLANLDSVNGRWVPKQGTIGQPFYTPRVDVVSGECTYHFSMVVDTNQQANQWRETQYRDINGDIHRALTTTYQDDANGQCDTSPSPTRSEYNIVDYEAGLEIFTPEGQTIYPGTLQAAYSLSLFHKK